MPRRICLFRFIPMMHMHEHEGDNGKTEMWYVVDADEGAHLIYGFSAQGDRGNTSESC